MWTPIPTARPAAPRHRVATGRQDHQRGQRQDQRQDHRTHLAPTLAWAWTSIGLLALNCGVTLLMLHVGAREWWPPSRFLLDRFGPLALAGSHCLIAGLIALFVPWIARYWPRLTHYEMILITLALAADSAWDLTLLLRALPHLLHG